MICFQCHHGVYNQRKDVISPLHTNIYLPTSLGDNTSAFPHGNYRHGSGEEINEVQTCMVLSTMRLFEFSWDAEKTTFVLISKARKQNQRSPIKFFIYSICFK